MHEYSVVEALVSRVAEAARERGAVAVHRVVVSVGELSGVDADLLRTAYRTFREGTVCAEAELDLRRVEAVWSCPDCRRPVARGAVLTCERCGAAAQLGPGGDAILLEQVELEVP